jgi:hypothetical protein
MRSTLPQNEEGCLFERHSLALSVTSKAPKWFQVFLLAYSLLALPIFRWFQRDRGHSLSEGPQRFQVGLR